MKIDRIIWSLGHCRNDSVC